MSLPGVPPPPPTPPRLNPVGGDATTSHKQLSRHHREHHRSKQASLRRPSFPLEITHFGGRAAPWPTALRLPGSSRRTRFNHCCRDRRSSIRRPIIPAGRTSIKYVVYGLRWSIFNWLVHFLSFPTGRLDGQIRLHYCRVRVVAFWPCWPLMCAKRSANDRLVIITIICLGFYYVESISAAAAGR